MKRFVPGLVALPVAVALATHDALSDGLSRLLDASLRGRELLSMLRCEDRSLTGSAHLGASFGRLHAAK
jgi:hypothetical protein